jgi:hypothetical protein
MRKSNIFFSILLFFLLVFVVLNKKSKGVKYK